MRLKGRKLRHKRIRKTISGTDKKPRLCVHRSLANLHAQLIDDLGNKTIASLSTLNADVKAKIKYGGNSKAAEILGEALAKLAVEKGITEVVFDRAGYAYHGRVKALAEACRKNGLKF